MTLWLAFIRYVVGLSWRIDRRRTLVSTACSLVALIAVPLFALASKLFVDAAIAGAQTRTMVLGAIIGLLAVARAAFLSISRPVTLELGEQNSAAFDDELMALAGGSAGLEHLDTPEHADRLELARTEGRYFMYAMAMLSAGALAALQLAFTMVLLAAVRPILLLLLAFAIVPLVTGRWAKQHVENTKAATAEAARHSRHLLALLTQAGPAKEVRVLGLGDELRRLQRESWTQFNDERGRSELRAAIANVAGQLVFALGYLGALFVVVNQAVNGHQTVGAVVLTVILASQVTMQLSMLTLQAGMLRPLAYAVERLLWLRDVASRQAPAGDRPPPAAIGDALELRNVSFSYAGSSSPVLENITLRLPAGTVVAIVGENGAGKTTLVKLIARFYEPSSGTITLDGEDIRSYDLDAWRRNLTAGFQDYAQLEVLARETVGVGHLPSIDDGDAVRAALDRARAADVLATLPQGLETPLGRSWSDGSELSGGQWQKLALGRTMMRSQPLLVLLDEPTAALDAHAEHVLFERYAHTAREAATTTGAITLLVSHRFSTVRMADLIVVLDNGQILEQGTHDELMANNDTYADLYQLQAEAYT